MECEKIDSVLVYHYEYLANGDEVGGLCVKVFKNITQEKVYNACDTMKVLDNRTIHKQDRHSPVLSR